MAVAGARRSGAANDCRRRKSASEFYVEVSGMHQVVTVALVIGFMAVLIIGFLSVAHDLLSRIIVKSRSRSNEVRPEQIDRACGNPQPNDQDFVHAKSDC